MIRINTKYANILASVVFMIFPLRVVNFPTTEMIDAFFWFLLTFFWFLLACLLVQTILIIKKYDYKNPILSFYKSKRQSFGVVCFCCLALGLMMLWLWLNEKGFMMYSLLMFHLALNGYLHNNLRAGIYDEKIVQDHLVMALEDIKYYKENEKGIRIESSSKFFIFDFYTPIELRVKVEDLDQAKKIFASYGMERR